MKPIIKKTLQQKKTVPEKVRYLAYAYKEWLIAGILIIAVGGSLIYSVTRPKEEVVTAAVVSENALGQDTQEAMTAAVTQWAKEQAIDEDTLTINMVSYDEPAAVQAFTTRLAAGAIQIVVYPAAENQLWQERFGSQDLASETIAVGEDDYTLQVTNRFD
ncbi:hypothetical protein A5886_002869 [Enterococcus sp. 8G7_MSG3316]|uniref:Uncharacterized protein n=1 Tax=Candidatus Enterococcus testudinis TaxID=1834191 RepID=A0A242A9Q9_9ENTE|nr:hypothetical protein [Enterococcus sp. 8G7_MSG3316]OTN77768.1 hypothetical protein A5886_002869 [Enterococcus sp. 8G7_MSG3316]